MNKKDTQENNNFLKKVKIRQDYRINKIKTANHVNLVNPVKKINSDEKLFL